MEGKNNNGNNNNNKQKSRNAILIFTHHEYQRGKSTVTKEKYEKSIQLSI